MATKAKVKCAECKNVPEWAFEQNIVSFCGVCNKTVKEDDSCTKGVKREEKK